MKRDEISRRLLERELGNSSRHQRTIFEMLLVSSFSCGRTGPEMALAICCRQCECSMGAAKKISEQQCRRP